MTTALYASLGAIIIILLALRVSLYRLKYKVGIGTGENRRLDIAIRCHANAVEILPIAMLMLFLAELQGLHMIALHVAGLIFVVGRLLHVWGMTQADGGTSFGRYYGTLFTWLTVLLLAAINIVLYVMSLF